MGHCYQGLEEQVVVGSKTGTIDDTSPCALSFPILFEGILMQREETSSKVIGAAIEVHREIGPGLLENTYQRSLEIELRERGLAFQAQLLLPIVYKGHQVDDAYRLDLLVSNDLVVELKTVKEFEPIHTAQLMTYLKMTRITTGLLINFHAPVLRDGIKRVSL